MSEFPKPEDVFDGKLPKDDVTRKDFEASVRVLEEFTRVKLEEIHSLKDVVRVSRDLGMSIRKIVLSCGQIEIDPFSYQDPRIINRGNALINAGDFTLGQNVKKNAETNLVAATMIIRTKKNDESSTVTSVSAHSLTDWYSETQRITNDRFWNGKQLTNYYAVIPVNIEIDKMKWDTSVFAMDFRQKDPTEVEYSDNNSVIWKSVPLEPTRRYYPLKSNSSEVDFQGYTMVMQCLVKDLVEHLKESKFISSI